MIDLASYDHFTELPSSTVAQVMALGGRGVGWALKHDPPTIVAFDNPNLGEDRGRHVVGWSVIVYPDTDKTKPYVSVFVHPDWRPLGVGVRLVRAMNQRLDKADDSHLQSA